MANVVLGKVAISWKGEWSTSLTYTKQDVVRNGASAYICVADASTPGTFDTDEWELFAQGTSDIASTAGDIIYHDGTEMVSLPIGEHNQTLTVNLSGVPEWTSNPSRSSVRVRNFPMWTGVGMNSYEQWAIMDNGDMRAWGHGGHYGLGQGNNNSNRAVPNIIPFPQGFPGVKDDNAQRTYAYGYSIIDENNDLWVWGRKEYGVTGMNGDAWIPHNIMKVNDGANPFYEGKVDATKAAYLALPCGSESYACMGVLGTDGKVYMTGYNGHGQLARGSTSDSGWFVRSDYFNNIVDGTPAVLAEDNVTVVTPEIVGTPIVKLKLGRSRYTHGMAVDTSGRLHMWGYNGDYQLGNGNSTNQPTPFHLNQGSITGRRIVDVWGAWCCTYILDEDRNLHFCGSDHYGRSGLGIHTGSSGNNGSTRNPVLTIDDVELVAFDTYEYPAAYVMKTDKTLWATGYNGHGNLGIGSTSASSSWAQMDMRNFMSDEIPIKIFCNGQNSHNVFGCLTNKGRVLVCGYNGYGQLGLGHSSYRTILEPVICREFIVDAIFQGYERYMNLNVLLEDGQMLSTGCGDSHAMASEDGEEYWTLSPIRF